MENNRDTNTFKYKFIFDKRNPYDITYIYIVVPPISILLFNCATKIALLVCFHIV